MNVPAGEATRVEAGKQAGNMDNEKLICEVSRTPCIWNPSHTKHNDRTFIAQQWERIGEEVTVSGEMAKKKFKNLRDQFRLELRKVPTGKTGDPDLPLEEYLSTWPWFKFMFFLKDQMKGRGPNGNPTCTSMNGIIGNLACTSSGSSGSGGKRKCDVETTKDINITTGNSYEDFDSQQQHSPLEENKQQQQQYINMNNNNNDINNCAKKLKESSTSLELQSDFLVIEKQRLEFEEKRSSEERDSDRMFLLSLLGSIKTLEPRRAHVFRIKVQQLLYEAQYSKDFDLTTTTTTTKAVNKK
ncbi:hypothetical protein Pcinc_016705 [Petrolisthes cinctipes]|uniref:MADF domain-containing protein n=1 Tax=Petrolisthes cinctipes TaxID=88211 RepID=A0AAE1KQQ5_PETCI|nr:hypothetical protein Pcinc_016705 [Petrolisthes cinctipes]